jgi:MFS family permease
MADSKPADTAVALNTQSATNAVLTSGCVQFLTIYICAQAETQLFVQLTGSTAAAGMLLAKTMSISGLIEFIIGPTFGKLTDAFGRRKFGFIYPVYSMIMYSGMFLMPKNYWLCVCGRIGGWLIGTMCGGTVLTSTQLADLGTGTVLAKSLANYWSAIGFGILTGQFMGDNLMMYSGSPRFPYLLRVVVSALHTCFLIKCVPETLPPSKRKPFVSAIALDCWRPTPPADAVEHARRQGSSTHSRASGFSPTRRGRRRDARCGSW